ncbi:MAG: 50S ribosomal protein L10 [Mycoplasma sp.]
MKGCILKPIIQRKEQEVKELSELLNSSKAFILFEYKGINAASVTALRKQLFANGSKMKIIKNNIIGRAFQASSISEFNEMLTGPNAIIFGLEDELSIFKDLSEVQKELNFIKIKGAYFNGKFVTATEAAALAAIPGREGLYSMLLSCLQAPVRKVLYAFNAVAETK